MEFHAIFFRKEQINDFTEQTAVTGAMLSQLRRTIVRGGCRLNGIRLFPFLYTACNSSNSNKCYYGNDLDEFRISEFTEKYLQHRKVSTFHS